MLPIQCNVKCLDHQDAKIPLANLPFRKRFFVQNGAQNYWNKKVGEYKQIITKGYKVKIFQYYDLKIIKVISLQ